MLEKMSIITINTNRNFPQQKNALYMFRIANEEMGPNEEILVKKNTTRGSHARLGVVSSLGTQEMSWELKGPPQKIAGLIKGTINYHQFPLNKAGY